MKKRNIGILILVIATIVFLLGYIMSYANTGETLHVNLTRLDTTGIGYGIGNAEQSSGNNAVIWNITTHDANGAVSATQRNLYCVKANYGATWETAGGPSTVLDYNLSYDLQKDRTELLNKIVDNGTDIDDVVKTLLSESGYYRELLWILDNSYIPGTTDKKEFLKSIGIEYDSELQAYVYNPISGYDYSTHVSGNSMMFGYSEAHLMTDADIKAVQRAAIWYYTNYKQDPTNNEVFNNKERTDWLTITKDGTTYQQLADYNKTTGEGPERFEQAQILYNYLIDAASNNKGMYTASNNYTVDGGVKVNTDGLSASSEGKYKLTTTRVGSNYVVGPIKIEKNGTIPYGVTIEVTDQNGNKLNYTYTDKNGNSLGTTDIKTLVGRDGGFYITVVRANVEKVNVKIEVTQTTTKKTLWLKGTESTDKIVLEKEQPIVEVTRKEEKVPTEFEGQPEEFDLALRKYITQVNGTNVANTRVPNIDLLTLQSGTTATYKHRKDPVVVNDKDEVTYTLAIYNEGNKEGYASEIVDQLPTGLVMSSSTASTVVSKDKNGNTKNTYTVKYEASTNKITLTIDTNSAKSLSVYKTGTLDWETIEIKCKVAQTPDTQNQIILTNVAWISGAYDSESKTLITTKGQDRDSEPQTKPNVNKDNMQDYKGNETNKDDLTDKDYFYKGEQDDDDFEKLVLMPEINIPVTKVWNDSNNQDGKRATEVTIKLLADGVETGKTLVLNEANSWKGTFTGLPKKANGVDIVYTIKEEPVPSRYTVAITGDATEFTVTNTYTPETINIPVTKVWNDNNNQDGKRATEVTIKLLADGVETGKTLVLNESNSWKGTFTGLPKKANGVDIVYTIKEEPVPSGYTVAITGDTTGFTVTNTYSPEKINIPVTKIWQDDADKIRPESITVNLKKGTEVIDTVELNKENNWTHTFENLPKKENGEEIIYTVEEIEPEGYTASITGSMAEGFVITNKHEVSKKIFDLALRKYITKINDKDITTLGLNSRVPKIDLSTLQSGTTATYNHKKDPIAVEEGDIVTYQLTIYNEGEKAGYASQIVDQLPEGLIYVPSGEFVSKDVDGNDKNKYIAKYESSINKITFEIAEDQEIKDLEPYSEGKLDRETLEIKCKVVYRANTEKKHILTNVAWINEEYNTTDNVKIEKVGDDRDSEPQTKPNVNKDNMENYKGNEANKDNLSDDGYYYKGEQDDDDFEKLYVKTFDLALRKFIMTVNGEKLAVSREPVVDVTPLKEGTGTTAIYKHSKVPVALEVGDTVVYTIRVYNEGEIAGTASEVKDYLPPYLIYLEDSEINKKYGWEISEDGRIATTKYLANTEIKEFNGEKLDYADVQIECKVANNSIPHESITNIAEISEYTYNETVVPEDRDSKSDDMKEKIPEDKDLPDYKKDKEKDDYVPGNEDDDDFEKVYVKELDLALRKFITSVNDEKPEVSRVPVVDVTPLKNGTGTTAIYNHTKEPLSLKAGDKVVYTIRIYNEGEVAGTASEIKDYLPPYLIYLEDSEINKKYGWKISEDGRIVTTDYLSNTQIKEFDGEKLDYADVQIECKVAGNAIPHENITNIAEITEYKYEETVVPKDRDSKSDNMEENIPEDKDLPDYKKDKEKDQYVPGNEDDDDFEKVYVKEFDLALRKFITEVQGKSITNRVPQPKMEDGKITYEHTKEPLTVHVGDTVIYTLRIYNEGEIDGYASEVSDDIPEHLEYLPEESTNIEYMWKMYDENGEETTDVSKAVKLTTTYLSKENGEQNLLKAFDGKTLEGRDIKIAFKVKDPNSNSIIITNKAQISDDTDKDGKDITDKDSTPDEWNEGEDDQDVEHVKVEYFDLALLKFVSKVIVIEDGKETISETGYNGHEAPEPVVKVELHKKKLNDVTVKFGYGITIINEGDIPGYAKEITDYVPEGLKFEAEDNPLWTDEGNNVISTKQLENTLLQPGETATVEVILTWINDPNNMGLKTNTAEISQDKNEYDVPDRDSTPDNKKEGEDDIDIAKVILSVTTGTTKTYFSLALGLIAIIGTGIVLIKKYVIE